MRVYGRHFFVGGGRGCVTQTFPARGRQWSLCRTDATLKHVINLNIALIMLLNFDVFCNELIYVSQSSNAMGYA